MLQRPIFGYLGIGREAAYNIGKYRPELRQNIGREYTRIFKLLHSNHSQFFNYLAQVLGIRTRSQSSLQVYEYIQFLTEGDLHTCLTSTINSLKIFEVMYKRCLRKIKFTNEDH